MDEAGHDVRDDADGEDANAGDDDGKGKKLESAGGEEREECIVGETEHADADGVVWRRQEKHG